MQSQTDYHYIFEMCTQHQVDYLTKWKQVRAQREADYSDEWKEMRAQHEADYEATKEKIRAQEEARREKKRARDRAYYETHKEERHARREAKKKKDFAQLMADLEMISAQIATRAQKERAQCSSITMEKLETFLFTNTDSIGPAPLSVIAEWENICH
jgi:hypothetical protein